MVDEGECRERGGKGRHRSNEFFHVRIEKKKVSGRPNARIDEKKLRRRGGRHARVLRCGIGGKERGLSWAKEAREFKKPGTRTGVTIATEGRERLWFLISWRAPLDLLFPRS